MPEPQVTITLPDGLDFTYPPPEIAQAIADQIREEARRREDLLMRGFIAHHAVRRELPPDTDPATTFEGYETAHQRIDTAIAAGPTGSSYDETTARTIDELIDDIDALLAERRTDV